MEERTTSCNRVNRGNHPVPSGEKWLRYNPGMALSREEVEHIALLAHLKLTEEELTRFRGQLESILAYASRLGRVDTSSISPTTTVLPIRSILREDNIRASLDREEAFDNAPQRDRDMFRIPPVFE
jgi:aspartyl-tRNA(Asn)/glutamyl-tRNA(Gln) amidotransferase subunit C